MSNSTKETLNSLIYPNLSHEIVFSDLEPKEKGDYFTMTCPSCGKRNEFYAYKGVNYGDCNRKNDCGKRMTWWDYVQNKFSLSDKKDVLQKLAELARVELPKPSFNPADKPLNRDELTKNRMYELFFKRCKEVLITSKDEDIVEVYQYLLNERMFTPDEILKYDFGFFPAKPEMFSFLAEKGFSNEFIMDSALGTGWYGAFYKLVIPYRDQYGRIAGFVCRLHKSANETIKDNTPVLKKMYRDSITYGGIFDKILNSSAPIDNLKSYIEEIKDKKESQEYKDATTLESIIDIPKYKYSKGLDIAFFNEKIARSNKIIFIVEGVFDVLKLASKGMNNVIGIGRNSLSKKQYESLLNSNITDIYFIPDTDDAGMNGVKESIKMVADFKKVKSYVVTYNKYKDTDEYVRNEGIDNLKKDIARAELAPLWLVKTMLSPPADLSCFTDSYKEKVITEIISYTVTIEDKSIRSLVCNLVKNDKDYKRPISKPVESLVKERNAIRKAEEFIEINLQVNAIRNQFISKAISFMSKGNNKEIERIANEEFKQFTLHVGLSNTLPGKKYLKFIEKVLSFIGNHSKLKNLLISHSNGNHGKVDFNYENFTDTVVKKGYEYFRNNQYDDLKVFLNSQKALASSNFMSDKSENAKSCVRFVSVLLDTFNYQDYNKLRLLLVQNIHISSSREAAPISVAG